LGAEKALFRALKTKHDTPKYGLIYHASLIGQAAPKNKGKISRVLAAKTALAIRVDALGDAEGPTIAIENKVKVETRIRQLEGGQMASAASTKTSTGPAKYDAAAAKALAPPKFNTASDMVIDDSKDKKKKKRSHEESNGNGVAEEVEEEAADKKKKKKKKEEAEEPVEVEEEVDEVPKDKKKKKKKDA
jgi:nucleolar protein 58